MDWARHTRSNGEYNILDLKYIYIPITQQWCSLKRVTKETRGNWRRVTKLGPIWEACPGAPGWASSHPTPRLWCWGFLHDKESMVYIYFRMCGAFPTCLALYSRSQVFPWSKPKTILCFAVSRNWGMTAGRWYSFLKMSFLLWSCWVSF